MNREQAIAHMLMRGYEKSEGSVWWNITLAWVCEHEGNGGHFVERVRLNVWVKPSKKMNGCWAVEFESKSLNCPSIDERIDPLYDFQLIPVLDSKPEEFYQDHRKGFIKRMTDVEMLNVKNA
jgi:hypothetical protein